MEQNAEDSKKPGAYAYVTYRNDICAFAAVENNENQILKKLKCDFKVLTADTWKQPPEQNLIVESIILDQDQAPIFKLNEDCFEKLFQYLDVDSSINLLEVCKKLNALVSKHGFKHTRSFEYCLYGQVTLSQMRRSLKRIGKQIDRLRFSSEEDSHRYFEILGRYVGNNVRYFYLDVVGLKECNITPIKPIFENLTALDIANSYYEIFDFALFQILCPNLIKLKLHFGGIQRFVNHNKPWPKLRNLTVKSNQCNAYELSEFLEQNPQITTFKLRQSRSLKQIARYLPNVQRLTIDSQHCKPDDISSSLITLKSLTKLSIKPTTNNS